MGAGPNWRVPVFEGIQAAMFVILNSVKGRIISVDFVGKNHRATNIPRRFTSSYKL